MFVYGLWLLFWDWTCCSKPVTLFLGTKIIFFCFLVLEVIMVWGEEDWTRVDLVHRSRLSSYKLKHHLFDNLILRLCCSYTIHIFAIFIFSFSAKITKEFPWTFGHYSPILHTIWATISNFCDNKMPSFSRKIEHSKNNHFGSRNLLYI